MEIHLSQDGTYLPLQPKHLVIRKTIDYAKTEHSFKIKAKLFL